MLYVLTVYPAVSWAPRIRAHEFRPSVCPFVCPSVTVTRVIHAKTVEVRIVQFSPYRSPIVFER